MPPRAGQRVTLTAVAEAVGVSTATVSKVINGRSDVAPSTRARVQAALLEHDYIARGIGGSQPGARNPTTC